MVGQIKTVNGVKKIVPLTAEARAGNPVSTIIAIYSNLVPYGYLPCNGVQFDETQFPALYAILGDNHTPDLRECALVGAGQNATDTIATHDVYDVGEFKDDQLQDHAHYNTRHSQDYTKPNSTWTLEEVNTYNWGDKDNVVWARLGRIGSTTHGKQKGVNYCIKATAGLDESDADYVLGVLAPVDEVAVDNMHSVTSNAVYGALNTIESYTAITGLVLRKIGRIVFGVYARYLTSSNPFTAGNLPQDWRPQSNTQVALINSSNDTIVGQAVVYSSDGKIMLWNGVEGSFGGSQYAFSICYFV